MKIDTSHCKHGCTTTFLKKLIGDLEALDEDRKAKVKTVTVYVYDNDLVDAGEEPFSITDISIGDTVKQRGESSKEFVVTEILPATYGFMNIFLKDSDGKECCAYSGDLEIVHSLARD